MEHDDVLSEVSSSDMEVKEDFEIATATDDFDLLPLPEVTTIDGHITVEEKKQHSPTERVVAQVVMETFRDTVHRVDPRMKITLNQKCCDWIHNIVRKYKTYDEWAKSHQGFVQRGLGDAFKLLFEST